jgi:uncharacterized membrane protein YgcG
LPAESLQVEVDKATAKRAEYLQSHEGAMRLKVSQQSTTTEHAVRLKVQQQHVLQAPPIQPRAVRSPSSVCFATCWRAAAPRPQATADVERALQRAEELQTWWAKEADAHADDATKHGWTVTDAQTKQMGALPASGGRIERLQLDLGELRRERQAIQKSLREVSAAAKAVDVDSNRAGLGTAAHHREQDGEIDERMLRLERLFRLTPAPATAGTAGGKGGRGGADGGGADDGGVSGGGGGGATLLQRELNLASVEALKQAALEARARHSSVQASLLASQKSAVALCSDVEDSLEHVGHLCRRAKRAVDTHCSMAQSRDDDAVYFEQEVAPAPELVSSPLTPPASPQRPGGARGSPGRGQAAGAGRDTWGSEMDELNARLAAATARGVAIEDGLS